MKVLANVRCLLDNGTEVTVEIAPPSGANDLTEGDRALICNLLHAIGTRLADESRIQAEALIDEPVYEDLPYSPPEDPMPDVLARLDQLQRENAELRRIVAAVPPGTPGWTPPQP